MIGWILGAVVAAFVVAGLLLSESDRPNSWGRSRNSTALGVVFGLLLLVMIWGGGIAEFVGCVCIVLKLLAVEPVASWTWIEVLMPLIGGIVVQLVGVLIAGALE